MHLSSSPTPATTAANGRKNQNPPTDQANDQTIVGQALKDE